MELVTYLHVGEALDDQSLIDDLIIISLHLPVIIYHITFCSQYSIGSQMRRNQSLSDLIAQNEQLNIDKTKAIGSGTYGVVYKATYKGRDVAAKQLKTLDASAHNPAENLMRELRIMASVNHPATLGLVAFQLAGDAEDKEESPMKPLILTPLMTNGTLEEVQKKEFQGKAPPQWNATAKSKVVFGVAVGMAYLHSIKIVHRDLKPQNVFLNENFEPVIADFGLSRLYALDMTTCLGTPLYMAPELWSVDGYSGAVDVYAYAILLYTLFSNTFLWDDGRKPQSDLHHMMRIRDGIRLQRQPEIPDFYWELIQRCWSGVPDDRPEFCEIIAWLQKDREKYAFPGTDMRQLEEYEKRVLQGVELVNRTKPPKIEIPDFEF